MLVKAKISIIGKKAILFHRFSVDTLSIEKKERTGVAGNDPEEWKRSVLKTKDNQLYLDPTYIFGCLRDGAKHTKAGRASLQSKMAATLTILDSIILLDRFLPEENQLTQDITAPVYLDIRSVKNPATKGRNVRYRVAASPGWNASFFIEWDNTVISTSQMKAVLKDSGALVGLGDGRSIGFGRFEVMEFAEVKKE